MISLIFGELINILQSVCKILTTTVCMHVFIKKIPLYLKLLYLVAFCNDGGRNGILIYFFYIKC